MSSLEYLFRRQPVDALRVLYAFEALEWELEQREMVFGLENGEAGEKGLAETRARLGRTPDRARYEEPDDLWRVHMLLGAGCPEALVGKVAGSDSLPSLSSNAARCVIARLTPVSEPEPWHCLEMVANINATALEEVAWLAGLGVVIEGDAVTTMKWGRSGPECTLDQLRHLQEAVLTTQAATEQLVDAPKQVVLKPRQVAAIHRLVAARKGRPSDFHRDKIPLVEAHDRQILECGWGTLVLGEPGHPCLVPRSWMGAEKPGYDSLFAENWIVARSVEFLALVCHGSFSARVGRCWVCGCTWAEKVEGAGHPPGRCPPCRRRHLRFYDRVLYHRDNGWYVDYGCQRYYVEAPRGFDLESYHAKDKYVEAREGQVRTRTKHAKVYLPIVRREPIDAT